MLLATGLCPDPLGGSYSAPPATRAVIRGGEGGRKGKERVGNRDGKNRRERKDVKG